MRNSRTAAAGGGRRAAEDGQAGRQPGRQTGSQAGRGQQQLQPVAGGRVDWGSAGAPSNRNGGAGEGEGVGLRHSHPSTIRPSQHGLGSARKCRRVEYNVLLSCRVVRPSLVRRVAASILPARHKLRLRLRLAPTQSRPVRQDSRRGCASRSTVNHNVVRRSSAGSPLPSLSPSAPAVDPPPVSR